jgi:hypothetical protein
MASKKKPFPGAPLRKGSRRDLSDEDPASGPARIEVEGISGAPIATYESRNWKNGLLQEHWDRGSAERQERRRLEREVKREIADSHLMVGKVADEVARPRDDINGNRGVLPDPAARKVVIERLASAILADRFDAEGGVVLPESAKPGKPKSGVDMRESWALYHREGHGAADHEDWLRSYIEPAYITREAAARFMSNNAYPWPKSLGEEPIIEVAIPSPGQVPVSPASADQSPRIWTAEDLENAYGERIAKLGRFPTIAEDEEWRKQPSISITRTRMRKLRTKFVPADIKKGGPRKKS